MRNFFLVFISCFLVSCNSFLSEKISCPKAVIIAEFSKSIDFKNNIPIRTEMDSLYPRCTINGKHIYMDLRLRLTSLRPLPSFHAPMTVKPSYFVAMINKAGDILSRTNHTLEITLEENQTTKVSFQQIEEKIPLGRDVTIYVGFNLDEAQLNLLQKERNKKIHDHRP